MSSVGIGETCADFQIDFSQIRHWTGNGENQAALVIQFLDNYEPKAYVWGYRWEDGKEAVGEDMIRAVAGECDDFCALVQYTGSMGSTLDGVGYSKNRKILDHIEYDFEKASNDPYVMFGFFSPNTLMGQNKCPGEDAKDLCIDAINNAKVSGIIEHPLNYKEYGYPAYDYDWWQSSFTDSNNRWNSGWYTGYWSYWIGSAGVSSEEYSYSGLGMSSMKLQNGSVNAWKFMPLNGPINPSDWTDGSTGASVQWCDELDYVHAFSSSTPVLTESIASEESDIYDLNGRKIKHCFINETYNLPKGIYIVKAKNATRKILIK